MDRRELAGLLDGLVKDGVLSAMQRQEVEARLAPALPQPKDRVGAFVTIVATLGALLVAGGLFLFIAAGWESMARPVKLALIGAVFVGVHAAGYLLSRPGSGSPRLGRSLTVLGVLVLGGVIALVEEIYDLPIEKHWGMLAWWALNVPLLFVTRSRAILWIELWLFCGWLIWCTGDWLSERDGHREADFLVAFALLGLSTAALFKGLMLLSLRRGFAGFAPVLRTAAAPLAIAGVYALSFRDPLLRAEAPAAHAFALLPALLDGAAAVLLLVPALLANDGADREDAMSGLGLIVAGGVLAAGVALFPSAVYLLANALLLVGLVALIGTGVKRGIAGYVNVGILGFLLLVFTRYFEYLFDVLEAFWSFIGAGVLLMVFGWRLEQRRRGWVAAARAREA